MCPDSTHKKKPYTPAGNDIHYPGQTNHDACFIPENVRQYAGEPLYIIVAHWCVQQQSWVRYNQISEAFHITAKRACYLIAYLRNKPSRVDCISRYQTLPNKARRYEVYVVRVLENPSQTRRARPPSPPVSRRRIGNADKAQANALWNQLCSNRNAGKMLKEEDEDEDA
ncbi:CaiF/GrlA family transcriptional regulator [Salmonella enterica]|uniref:CaiF/GrlA family transcriptional regulator n=1 Tax=Salmonella enterica TaxID=28901 RepID=UPI00046F2EA0|nr:CaiF/GrlA family transcriptional regulator [Salmonella enterica]EDT7230059.1 CaiF/GrlA family transcriptional regulator [Salmonella enterica subsp. enterica]EAY8076953.1 CaiF/GrlA family transcriptional regulator [Salmonella enterica]EBO3471969.1 CaiF/GrlA family transcriptional regulator [Salmonella enterica]ECG7225611.1 CaiF/GrlA family transcriptional regulator [Salmonella enterica subsp. enterica serovar Bovismorbificans]ECL8753851.1 CaiF/GrlA family transcriptional regulator [Salmonell